METPKTFGQFFKQCRLQQGHGLREFCVHYGHDPGNISKMERGMLPPPDSRDKLEEYANNLGLKQNSKEWLDFFDRASEGGGKVPAYMTDNTAVMEKLPLLFRTIHDKGLDAERIEALIERLRTS